MQLAIKISLKLAIIFSALLILVACSTTQKQELTSKNTVQEKAEQVVSGSEEMEIYEVHHNGRIHVFYNRDLYKEFLQLGETSFRLTRIGAGPKGETMVFGLISEDKKKAHDSVGIKLYDKIMAPSDQFYGEMIKHGRIYVFTKFEDMKTVRDFGHPNFFYSEIGAGPKGETVIYVLNNKTKRIVQIA